MTFEITSFRNLFNFFRSILINNIDLYQLRSTFDTHMQYENLKQNLFSYRVFLLLGPRPSAPYFGSRPSAARPPGPIKFVSAVFDFLPVSVIKYSCGALIKHNCEFSIYKISESKGFSRRLIKSFKLT